MLLCPGHVKGGEVATPFETTLQMLIAIDE